MIGFDRPLKPSWIYEFIKIVEIGDKITDHNPEFESILWELDGKDGKRKIRTVLSRYFFKTAENPKSKYVEYTPLVDICKNYPLEEIKPLLLYHLLMRSAVLRKLTMMIQEIYGDQNINYPFLRKKVIEKFGERDISARSLRNLMATLVNFDILERINTKEYTWKNKLFVNEMNACYMLKLYSEEFKKSPQVNLDDLEDYLFLYFTKPDFSQIANKYNAILWEYSVRMGHSVITFHENQFWDQETLIKAFKKI